MQIELSKVKKFLRIDYDSDDDQITALICAAQAYLTNAGIPPPEKETPLYELAVMLLVSHWHENRCPTGQTTQKLDYSLRNIITQLQWEG